MPVEVALVTRKRRTRVLVAGDPSMRRTLAQEVRDAAKVEVLSSPRVALIQVTVRESARRSLFHLGEVLVSEAKVLVDGHVGLGLLLGRDLEAALELALIDAAWSAAHPVTVSWSARIEAEETRLEAELDREQASLAATAVEFETLDSGAAR